MSDLSDGNETTTDSVPATMPSTALVPLMATGAGTAVTAAPHGPQMHDWLAGQLSGETTRAYRSDLRQFIAFAAARGVRDFGDVTRGLVIAYRDDLHTRRYAVASIARKLSCVRQALAYAQAEGIIAANPAKLVKSYKVPDVSPRHALDNAKARELLALPDRQTVKGARDYAMLSLLLYLGLRRAEVAALRIECLGDERSHKTLRIHGKGDKVRLLPVPASVYQAVRDYLAMDGRAETSTGPLFRPVRNRTTGGTLDKTISADGVWRVVTTYARAVGLADLDVHTLRHTALTAALDGGASLRRVQAMAGHADPKTTARYDSRRADLDDSAVYRVNYA